MGYIVLGVYAVIMAAGLWWCEKQLNAIPPRRESWERKEGR